MPADSDLQRASRRRLLLSEGIQPDELGFELALDEAADYILALAVPSGPLPKPGNNAAQVGPDARYKLRGILKHYAKKPHPFAACVRDNRKRFGPRAEAVCAVVKDLIRGTTKWRGHNNPNDKGTAGLTGLSELLDDGDVAEALLDDTVFAALAKLADEPGGVERVIEILEDDDDA